MREPARGSAAAAGDTARQSPPSAARTKAPERTATDARATSTTQLSEAWRRPAQIIWLALAALSLGLFAIGLPAYVAALHTVCIGAPCPSAQLTPAGAQVLQGVGVSLNTYAVLVALDTVVITLIFCAVGGVIAWRRSDDWLALLVAYMLVAMGTALVTGSLAAPNDAWRFLDSLASFLGYAPAFFLVMYLFPDGTFRPRWLGWSILVVGIIEAGNILLPGTALDINAWVPNLENLCFFGLLAALAGAQLYRYRRVYSPIQRQQSKWMIFSIAIFAAFGLVIYVLEPLLGNAEGSVGATLGVLSPLLFGNVFAALFPVSFAIAIFRYRLWDIDVIINRTLVYGSLTALLVAFYYGAVIGLQALAQALTGQRRSESIVIVISTLLSAALVEPLRRWLQAVIDRRFYRRKYDMQGAITAFGALLQTETDLTELSERLIVVARETMQPAHVSLWLRSPRLAEDGLAQRASRHVPGAVSTLGEPSGAPLPEPLANRL